STRKISRRSSGVLSANRSRPFGDSASGRTCPLSKVVNRPGASERRWTVPFTVGPSPPFPAHADAPMTRARLSRSEDLPSSINTSNHCGEQSIVASINEKCKVVTFALAITTVASAHLCGGVGRVRTLPHRVGRRRLTRLLRGCGAKSHHGCAGVCSRCSASVDLRHSKHRDCYSHRVAIDDE